MKEKINEGFMKDNIANLSGKTIEYGDYLVYSFFLTPELLEKANDNFFKLIKRNKNYGKPNFESYYDCTFWSLDITFTDGSNLSEAEDQYGIKLEVNEQYNSKALFVNQINYKCINLAEFAGKTIKKAVMTYPIDIDIKIADIIEVDHFIGDIVDLIDTRRGTNNTSNYFRGNTFPVVSEPFGFLFGMPFTNSLGSNQPYIYSSNKLYGFGISHIYDYKKGDEEAVLCFARQKGEKREFAEFSHFCESAKPYIYSVIFNNKVKACMTVHKYTCLVEYDFTETSADSIEIIVKKKSKKSFLHTVIQGGTVKDIKVDSKKTIYTVDFRQKKKVVVNLTQSFISQQQARFNYKNMSFNKCTLILNRAWKKQLSKYTVGGTNFFLTQIFYSNIFRMHLYPNMFYEKMPDGKIVHPDIHNVNGEKPIDGPLMINNDFSKTYKLVWPAFFLLHISQAQELLSGLLQNYFDSGKIFKCLSTKGTDDINNIYLNIILQSFVLYNANSSNIQNIFGSILQNSEIIKNKKIRLDDYTRIDQLESKICPVYDKDSILDLYGNQDNLIKALDNYFFSEREFAKKKNWTNYHKLVNGLSPFNDIRFGLFNLDNLANYNIPFLYSYAKNTKKMQKIVSEIWYYLQVGSDIGYGYLGDEDQGVMSAFYFFIGLGLYPLNPLSGEFVITAPRFPFCELDLPNGRLIINAPLANRENCCVKSVKLNGELHKGLTINYEEIKNGAYLEFELEKG